MRLYTAIWPRSRIFSRSLFTPYSWIQRMRWVSNDASPNSRHISRFQKFNSRLPIWLQKYTLTLRDAPVSHISSFLILHELTAIVPLFSFAAIFHYFNWLPPFISEWKWASDGVQKFGNYFRKKGWIRSVDGAEEKRQSQSRWQDMRERGKKNADRWWKRGETGTRILVEVATAYAITKALLPFRLALSVWATPWFARVFVIPPTSKLRRFFGNPKPAHPSPYSQAKTTASPAAGTGATAGNVIPGKKDP